MVRSLIDTASDYAKQTGFIVAEYIKNQKSNLIELINGGM